MEKVCDLENKKKLIEQNRIRLVAVCESGSLSSRIYDRCKTRYKVLGKYKMENPEKPILSEE